MGSSAWAVASYLTASRPTVPSSSILAVAPVGIDSKSTRGTATIGNPRPYISCATTEASARKRSARSVTSPAGATLARTASVRLAVYDVNGREVARLVEARQGTGRYRVVWNAEGLASGVYLCRLTADTFTTTQQLVLQK